MLAAFIWSGNIAVTKRSIAVPEGRLLLMTDQRCDNQTKERKHLLSRHPHARHKKGISEGQGTLCPVCGIASRLGPSLAQSECPSCAASMVALCPIEKNKIRETGDIGEEQSSSNQGGRRRTFE